MTSYNQKKLYFDLLLNPKQVNTVNGNESLYNTGNLKVEKKLISKIILLQFILRKKYIEIIVHSAKVIKVNIIAFCTF